MKDKRYPSRLPMEWWNRLNKIAPGHMKGDRNRSLQNKWVIEFAEKAIKEKWRAPRRGPLTKGEVARLRKRKA